MLRDKANPEIEQFPSWIVRMVPSVPTNPTLKGSLFQPMVIPWGRTDRIIGSVPDVAFVPFDFVFLQPFAKLILKSLRMVMFRLSPNVFENGCDFRVTH